MNIDLRLGDNRVSLKELSDNSVDSVKNNISLKYEVTKEGKVINLNTGKETIFNRDGKGYMKARLYTPLSTNKDGRKPYRLHRLVAMFYLDNYNNELQVNHKDGNKENNNVSNLEMVNNSQNAIHAWANLDKNNERRSKLKKCPITGKFIKKNN